MSVSDTCAQTGSLNGQILTSDGQPAEFVNVGIKDLQIGTITDAKGHFRIKKVPAGNYILYVQLIGYSAIEQYIEVKGETTVPAISLKENAQVLQELLVKGNTNRFAQKESEYIARLPLKNMENPQVYNVVSKEIMQEQIVTDYKSAFKNIPGANSGVSHSSNGRYMNVTRGFNLGNAARNGVGTSSVAEIDPANLERIEAIKGPSGTLYGASLSTFGGLFNRVTKKPFDVFKGQVSLTTGTWNLNRLTADINTPLNDEKTVLFRINTALHGEKSFQDAGFSKTYLVAPTLSIKVNDRLSVLFDAELYGRKGTNIYGNTIASTNVQVSSIDHLKIGYRQSFTNNSIIATTRTQNLYSQINYKISSQWTSQTNIGNSLVEFEFPAMTLNTITDSTVTRNIWDQYTRQVATQVQQNFIGDFKIAGFRNRIVAGLDYSSVNFDFPNTRGAVYDTVNFINPGKRYAAISINEIKNKVAAVTVNSGSSAKYNYMGAYFSDVFNLAENLMVMLSLRVDRFDNKGSYSYTANTTTGLYKQTALSPKFGVVYQPVKEKVAIFANYMNGYQFVAPVNQPDGSVSNFKPQFANQTEAGVKFDVLDNKISATISYYDIKVVNQLRTDMERDPVNGNRFQIQDGNQTSRGIDFELIINPVYGLNILAGYAYNASKLEKANENVNGRRPTNSGAENTANLWASYRLTSGAAKGLGLGAGFNYSGEQFVINNSAREFTIPAYTVMDATVFFEQPGYRIGLKLDNLNNERYWNTSLQPQTPRRFSASVTIKF
ncbi:iron complex outermembrane recepter protein [Dyadobacter koreensis]|uniref:Iron complex outermembrane recepter protein n=1 Tax=Dyadobacter koreensis TaxID=408657 RepID=A0A1H6Q3R6_9BACT|nr:TonB-dependent receptor [Dyadobacter koreensis]SEI38468.1 iron complex outermembrane recepter protein [Dyadobacter koreensis]